MVSQEGARTLATPPDARFRPPEQVTPQDWAAAAAYLAEQGRHLDHDVPPRQFAGGLANLNYLLSVDDRPVVLRRPPAGPVAEGANDMEREWRVLSHLSAHYPLAPSGVLYCPDPRVLGAPFQLIEYRDGIAVGARLPDGLAADASAPDRLTDELLHAMVALHELDPSAVGLGSLGRDDGFLERQLDGWARRADAAWAGAPPREVDVVVRALRRTVPAVYDVRLVHGDLKFDNMLLDVDTVRAVAVVDWDMTTRGDPLFDLAVLLSYWIEAGDPTDVHGLEQVPSLEPGFLRRREVAERYFAMTGRPAHELRFHLTLARLRLAVAWQQLFGLFERGAVTNPRYADFAALARAVLTWSADTLTDPLA